MYVKGFINTHIRKQKHKIFKCTHTYMMLIEYAKHIISSHIARTPEYTHANTFIYRHTLTNRYTYNRTPALRHIY